MLDPTTKNLIVLRGALDHHHRTCGEVPLSFRLNPEDFARLDFPVLWGVPIYADERVPPMDVRLACLSNEHEVGEECERNLHRYRAEAPV